LAQYWLPLLAGVIVYPLYRRRYGSMALDDPGNGSAKPLPPIRHEKS